MFCRTLLCARFEKLDQFQGVSSFYTWIYRIAVNLALSGYRRRHLRAVPLRRHPGAASPADDLPDESPAADPTYRLEQAEHERIVEDALNQLCPEHRAVIVLKDFDSRRYEEIAAILNIPVGTVRSRLHRARCELRDRLRFLVDHDQADEHGVTLAPRRADRFAAAVALVHRGGSIESQS